MHHSGASAEGEKISCANTQSQHVHNGEEDKARRTSLLQLCTAAQQEKLPKVNSEDHVVSPGYMQLQARHQSKALILSEAAASICGQKPGPRWTFLRQTGCHLQQTINQSIQDSCLQDSSGESTANNKLPRCVQAHAHKASWTEEQATLLLYSSICHTAAKHVSS